MKPNPCKRCGSVPYSRSYDTASAKFAEVLCRCSPLDKASGFSLEKAILGWNAMNPLPQSDKCGPMPVDEAEFAKGIAKQAFAIEQLRASDCPVESQEPVELSKPAVVSALTIACGKGRVRIGFDGKVELVDCELDEAAKAFWDMVRFYAPKGDK